jgi:chemotaxis protein MotA
MIALVFLLGSLAVIAIAMSIDGTVGMFWSLSSMVLVLLGTICVSAISVRRRDVGALASVLPQLWSDPDSDPTLGARRVLELGGRVRREGPQILEAAIVGFRDQPFFERAIALLIDGAEPSQVERVLLEEAEAISRRQRRVADIFRRAGDVAPAMGLIGTLIGLVQMLGQLSSPEAIGPAMALALLTTLYGAVLAHVVCIPLAVRTEALADAEYNLNRLYAVGTAAIGRREHPVRIEMSLNALLPVEQRVQAA